MFPLQFVDYLQNEPLVVEVYGRQDAGPGTDKGLTTRELMVRDSTKQVSKTGKRVSQLEEHFTNLVELFVCLR